MAGPGGLAGSLSLVPPVQSCSSCPFRGQCLIYGEKQGSLSLLILLCKRDRPKEAFNQQITGFFHFCLDSYWHFSSVQPQ